MYLKRDDQVFLYQVSTIDDEVHSLLGIEVTEGKKSKVLKLIG